VAGDTADQQIEMFFFQRPYQAEVAADRVRRMIESVDAQPSPRGRA